MKAAQQTSKTPSSKNLLVKFVAHSGLCSRRKAEQLIKMGEISVNNFIVKDPAYDVQEKDTVRYKKQVLAAAKKENFIYIVLNKPANMLCTSFDPEGRPTIFDLLKSSPQLAGLRLYNVGRLDLNTTGAILLTNDGDLAQRMTHPSFEMRKTYAVTLHQTITEERMEQIRRGVQLEDGFIRVDSIVPSRGGRHSQTVFVTLHSGKNRILRRIFEQMGLFIEKLERISFGPITKKGLAVGQARLLSNKEVSSLRESLD